MKIIGVIPARFESSRFPGKPLCEICGKPMIWWVYTSAKKAKNLNDVYVATDDTRIYDSCKALNINVIMTSKKHATGTDRVGEIAQKIEADVYVNIQGDEPMIEPSIIDEGLQPFLDGDDVKITNLMTKIVDPVDLINPTVPKVIVNDNNKGIFLTRSCAPYPKGAIDYNFYKQVCVYGFTKEALNFFCEKERGRVEKIEDIEILRFIENGYIVQYVEVESQSVAVDTEKDLERVRKMMSDEVGE